MNMFSESLRNIQIDPYSKSIDFLPILAVSKSLTRLQFFPTHVYARLLKRKKIVEWAENNASA